MIRILHQDDHLLVVDKPGRMLVVPAPGRNQSTVVDAVRQQLGGRVFAVHRLDEDTTGVLILARTEHAKRGLEDMFRGHRVERTYLALVSQMPSPPAGRIESRLHEDARGVLRSVSHGPGRKAVTHYATLRREAQGALVECRLETGRRNQIRVHMAELGCPVVGDRKYGYRARKGASKGSLMLHAWRVCFDHPVTGGEIAVRADVPDGFPKP